MNFHEERNSISYKREDQIVLGKKAGLQDDETETNNS